MGSLGKYDLIEQLGSGSMGTVYLARDTVLDRKVALKTIRTGGAVDEEVRERFYREAKTCAHLQHPSIVSVYDMGEQADFAYIAMELLLGSDLKKHIEQRSDLSLAVKLESMIQICDALSHAHREGIVHRDVKPSNLFLTTDLRAKVLDFGIARLPSSRLTIVGRVLGTPNYMAPEQILGNKSDGRADLFSAAVVFFELLVYHHPFQSSLIPRRIVDSEPDSIFDHDSSVPLPFEQIFKKALHKDPEQRYATGTELAADIRAVLEGVRLNASPTFSRVSLPSARSLPVESVPETPIFNEELGSGDPEEQRLSEFLRIIPYFEEAVDRDAYGEASAALDQLRAIERVDSRFVESVRLCESRLASIDPGANGADTALAGSPISPEDEMPAGANGDSKCASCGALNRGGAAFCFECGARRVDPKRSLDPSEASTPGEVARGAAAVAVSPGTAAEPTLLYVPTIAEPKAVAPPPRPASAVKPATSKDSSRGQSSASGPSWWTRTVSTVKLQVSATSRAFRIRLLIVTGAAIAIILALMLLTLLRGPAVQPYVATAKVGPGSARVYENRDTGRAVATVPEGTLLNVVEMPDSKPGGWLKTQWVAEGKPKADGYVQRASLHDFDTKDADTLLRFARTGGPGESGDIQQLRQQMAAYQTVENRFAGSSAARAASAERVKLNSALARLREAQHPPDPVAVVPPTEPPPMVASVPSAASVGVNEDLARAKRLLGNARYDDAFAALQRVLSIDPHNSRALKLRSAVQKGKDAEEATMH